MAWASAIAFVLGVSFVSPLGFEVTALFGIGGAFVPEPAGAEQVGLGLFARGSRWSLALGKDGTDERPLAPWDRGTHRGVDWRQLLRLEIRSRSHHPIPSCRNADSSRRNVPSRVGHRERRARPYQPPPTIRHLYGQPEYHDRVECAIGVWGEPGACWTRSVGCLDDAAFHRRTVAGAPTIANAEARQDLSLIHISEPTRPY